MEAKFRREVTIKTRNSRPHVEHTHKPLERADGIYASVGKNGRSFFGDQHLATVCVYKKKKTVLKNKRWFSMSSSPTCFLTSTATEINRQCFKHLPYTWEKSTDFGILLPPVSLIPHITPPHTLFYLYIKFKSLIYTSSQHHPRSWCSILCHTCIIHEVQTEYH